MKNLIPRDISWLSFNARVLQEASDLSVPLRERIRFLGIHSNNMDEFFRVRVATLKRMVELGGKKGNMHLEENPSHIIDQIQTIVLDQQNEFNRIWLDILKEMQAQNIYLVDEKKLSKQQQQFVKTFFEEEVRSNTIPLMIESLPKLPYLREKSIYLGVVMRREDTAYGQKYALIEVPSRVVGRFIKLPAPEGQQHIILLEDIIRFNLPFIFSYFNYTRFESYIFKVTKDAELDIDNDVTTSFVQKIEKGLKNRRVGKTTRFVFDKEMDAGLLEYLMKKLNLSRSDNIIPGGRIHNFRHFMDFPDVFAQKNIRRQAFTHPALINTSRVTDIILQQDVLLHFPYHSFNSVIDLLREAAMDPEVVSIRITAYRLAPNSKIVNALINAVRNGKNVIVMLELRARFDEEKNLEWKERLEEEGVKVLIGMPNIKVHAKLCVIKKRSGKKTVQYGFVSTGNLNERTAKVYADECMLTGNRNVMADINRIFKYLENPSKEKYLSGCKTLIVSPVAMRNQLVQLINTEIKNAKAGKKASIILKENSLSDPQLIDRLYDAAEEGVKINLIIRGIYCARFKHKLYNNVKAVSIVDEYLEHSRVMVFKHGGKEKIFISSADWMIRNLDHRIEAAIPVKDKAICTELKDILQIQLQDNVKARILDNALQNNYVSSAGKKRVRAQIETYNYLHKKIKPVEARSD
ncbi:MAG TPA: polyphosphate kinase 1 [Parafilimonas sp.]